MEDINTKKGCFMYSLRVDYMTETREQMIEKLHNWIEARKPAYWCVCEERGAETGKLHLQGAVWYPSLISGGNKSACRNWWQRTKGHISFTNARDVESLKAYVTKDYSKIKETNKQGLHEKYIPSENLMITNLTDEDLETFKKWEKDMKKVWLEKLEKKCKSIINEMDSLTPGQYVEAIVDYYTENKKAPPTRNTLYKFMLRYHPGFTAKDYIRDLGMFKTEQYNTY